MRAWPIDELGYPLDKCSVQDVTPPDVPEGMARIKTEAVELNFADVLRCQGLYQEKLDPPFTPGMAAGGLLLEDADPFKAGDRIIGGTMLGCGGYAEECSVRVAGSSKVPEGVSILDATAMNITFVTAWWGLELRGQVKSGERVLIVAAAGGVGSAAVQLAQIRGCYVIAAARGERKLQACRELGADEVVDYGDDDLYERVKELTDGKGVDVVYDPVGGDYFDIARRLVAREGRYLLIGFASVEIPTFKVNHALVRNYSLVGVFMGGYHGSHPAYQRCFDELYSLLTAGKFKPLIDYTVGFDDLGDALKALSERKTVGRVMFQPD